MDHTLIDLMLVKRRITELYGTQNAFAQEQGWSKQYLSRILTGKAALSLSRAAELAHVLGLSLSDIVSDDAVPPTENTQRRLLHESSVTYHAITETSRHSAKPHPADHAKRTRSRALKTLIHQHPEMDALPSVLSDQRNWESLTLSERETRARASRGILRWLPGSVDEFLTRKHADQAAEE